ncbi:hypothetical protein R1flu_019623 [Riccia fluitans]|uniref:DDE Tnp4 domain-containing protein n=1 Tax=Riccia fluitans TaxID=41844 RepID=A0ABD1ZJ66_9MARC
MLLSSGARPIGSSLLSTSNMELEPEATDHFTAAIGVTFTLLSSCLRDSQEWWVRQCSLVWFDDYLQRAYGGQRWNDVLRMPKNLFHWLCTMLDPSICRRDTRWRKSVPVPVRLAAVLSRLVTRHTYFYVSDRFGIGESTLAEIFDDCIDAINRILGLLFLCWPLPNETGAVADAFFRRSVGLPGGTNDQRLLTFSGLYNQVCNGSRLHWPVCRINGGFRLRPYLLGDSGYVHTPWLMVPFPQNAQLTEVEALYNEHHVRGRLIVKQAFGHLKGKFRILDLGVNSSISLAAKIAYSCCVLNNVLVKYRVGLWQKNVQPTYDRPGATLVQHLHDDRFTVPGNHHQGSDSELARETREHLGHFLALN